MLPEKLLLNAKGNNRVRRLQLANHMKPPWIILSRFAIRPEDELSGFLHHGFRNEIYQNPDWLEERLTLFEEWCAPSVHAQKLAPVGWLIFADEAVAPAVRERILNCSPPQTELVSVRRDESFETAVNRSLERFGPAIITTRLDTDDAISRNFGALLRKQARPGSAINFCHGYQYFTTEALLVHKVILSSPFLSFWSQCGLSVFSLGVHSKASQSAKLYEKWTLRPMYLKIAHQKNTASNGFGGLPVLWPGAVAPAFGLDHTFRLARVGPLVMLARKYLGTHFDQIIGRLRAAENPLSDQDTNQKLASRLRFRRWNQS